MKISKILNNCTRFESNRIEYWSNYSIWFEILNIRTALLNSLSITVGTEFNASPDTIYVNSEPVFKANHLTNKTLQKMHKLKRKCNSEKGTKAKWNYPGLVASYDTRPGNEVGLFYKTPEPT